MKPPSKLFLNTSSILLFLFLGAIIFLKNFNSEYSDKKESNVVNTSGKMRSEFTSTCMVSITDIKRIYPSLNHQVETPIVHSPINSEILFAASNITATVNGFSYTLGGYTSTNGGLNWFGTDTILFTPNMYRVDPAPVITATGKFIISFLNSNQNVDVAMLHSTNEGRDWIMPLIVVPNSSASDKCWLAMDDDLNSPYYGRLFSIFSKYTYNFQIFFSYSNDEGLMWQTADTISPRDLPFTEDGKRYHHAHLGAELKSSNGKLYLIWTKRQEVRDFKIGTLLSIVEDSLGFAKSLNGGLDWSASTNQADDMNGLLNKNETILKSFSVPTMPRLDIDKSTNRLYVVSAEKKYFEIPDTSFEAKDSADIILHRSTDEGTSWQRFRVNQDPFSTGENKFQFLPSIAVDEFGGVNVVYYDTRNTPNNDSCEIYLSRSTDGGEHWTDIKISEHKFKLVNYKRRGDYIGMTVSNTRLRPLWFEYFGEEPSGNFQAVTAEIDIMPMALELSVTTEGLDSQPLTRKDTFSVNVRNVNFPYEIIDASKFYPGISSISGITIFNNVETGNFYLSINHRNSIEIWSDTLVFLQRGSLNNAYSFVNQQSSSYGDNLVLSYNNNWSMYSGDVNQDGVIDGTDGSIIDNDALSFITGYSVSDLNGDEIVDGSDAANADNNSFNFVTKITP